jgi:hypothetical protein
MAVGDKSHPPNFTRLLRVRREGPRRRRTTEKPDELAPLHCQCCPVLPMERIAQHCALRDFDLA